MTKKIDIRKAFNISRYHGSVMLIQFMTSVATLLINLIVGIIVTTVQTKKGEPITSAGSLDIILIIWALIMGLALFGPSYKFALINGVSRRTYYIASAFSLFVCSLAWAVIMVIFAAISNATANCFMLFQVLYGISYGGMFLWMLGALLLFSALGWLVSILLYRLGNKGRAVMIATAVLIVPLVIIIDLIAGGAFVSALATFFSAVFGLSAAGGPNPFIGFAFLLGLTLILGVIIYYVQRGANTK